MLQLVVMMFHNPVIKNGPPLGVIQTTGIAKLYQDTKEKKQLKISLGWMIILGVIHIIVIPASGFRLVNVNLEQAVPEYFVITSVGIK